MSTPMMAFAIRLTRCWVRLYTKGLPPELRDARRAEIESDLWEQGYDGESNGHDPQETGLQVLLRLLAGVPADLTWRLEHLWAGKRKSESARAIERSMSMGSAALQKGLLGLTVIVGGLYVAGAISIVVKNGLDGDPLGMVGFAAYFVVPFVAAALLIAGLLNAKRSPWLSAGMITVATVAVSLVWFWLFMITIPLGLLVIGSAVMRARRHTRERDRLAAA